MSSRMTGLKRTLEWKDFAGTPTPKELQDLQRIAGNASGKTVGMAGTKSSFTVNFGGKAPDDPVLVPVPGSSPAKFTLSDNITVTVVFDPHRSWKQLDPLSDKGKQFLLDHEQGHYEISALMARDCFIDVMQLKAKTYDSIAAGQAEAKAIVKSYKDKLDKVQDKYDDDTTHGAWVTPSFLPERKETFQTKWEGFFMKARTQERVPAVEAPDGATYKIRLLDVLAAGGFTF